MPDWVAVCAVDDVELEDVVPFHLAGVDYAIYRSPDDRFFATEGRCTHERAPLCDGLVVGGIIECPKHNGRFNYATGKATRRPALIDLQTYPVKVEDGTVYVEI